LTTSCPISSIIVSVPSSLTSSSVIPSIISAMIEPPAWLIVHPSPSKLARSTRSSSPTLRYMVIKSPHPGFPPPSWMSASSIRPLFRGCS
jgi:hypothetical protein